MRYKMNPLCPIHKVNTTFSANSFRSHCENWKGDKIIESHRLYVFTYLPGIYSNDNYATAPLKAYFRDGLKA